MPRGGSKTGPDAAAHPGLPFLPVLKTPCGFFQPPIWRCDACGLSTMVLTVRTAVHCGITIAFA